MTLSLSALGACGEGDDVQGSPVPLVAIGGDRPVTIALPVDLTTESSAPVLILLHGYAFTAAAQESYLGLTPLVDELGFVYAMPDGTVDTTARPFWNATDACCDFYGSGVDDVAYLAGVIEEITAAYPVNPERVYLFGHSNGGFMAHRLACDRADLVAGFVSLAGATHLAPGDCAPSEPVHVLQLHGTDDDIIRYGGGSTVIGGDYPSAEQSVASWVAKNGCAGAPEMLDPSDLVPGLDGPETERQKYGDCDPGGSVALWSIENAKHIPNFGPGALREPLSAVMAAPLP